MTTFSGKVKDFQAALEQAGPEFAWRASMKPELNTVVYIANKTVLNRQCYVRGEFTADVRMIPEIVREVRGLVAVYER